MTLYLAAGLWHCQLRLLWQGFHRVGQVLQQQPPWRAKSENEVDYKMFFLPSLIRNSIICLNRFLLSEKN